MLDAMMQHTRKIKRKIRKQKKQLGKDYRFRIVKSASSLREKAIIFEHKYDDRIIEFDTPYGKLPVPEKRGYEFGGWFLSLEENGVEIYVQSVLPVNDQMSKFGVHNDEIARMNEGIRQLAEQYGMTYIDVYPSMLDGEGHLMKDYTIDGVHLTWQGYVTWQEVLQPYIDE